MVVKKGGFMLTIAGGIILGGAILCIADMVFQAIYESFFQ